MPNISYFPVEQLEDPELRGHLQHAAHHGTPRPESQAIRAHVPAVLRSFSEHWERVFRGGVVEHAIKELCRLYVSETVACRYCGSQRSLKGREQGVTEEHLSELLDFEASARYDERQKAALAYASALVWSPAAADDALWARLRAHFSPEGCLELGQFIALTYGQQSWIRTLGIGHHEVLDLGSAGLAPAEALR